MNANEMTRDEYKNFLKAYKEKNPEKYAAKKERLEAKLKEFDKLPKKELKDNDK